MSEWMKSIVGYLLIVSVTMQMLPNKKYEQYVKLFTGLLLIILVLQPILKIGSGNIFLENKISEFVQEQQQLEESIGEEMLEFEKRSAQLQEEETKEIKIQPVERVEVVLDD